MIGKKMTKKLRSTQGTSIFFGILFFLIASILSIVMLNGAVTAVKSVQSDRQAEQNFLTCSSAAKTLRDAITDLKVTRTQSAVYKETSTPINDATWSATSVSAATDSAASKIGEAYLMSWIRELTDNPTAGNTTTKTLTIQETSSDKAKEVSATITIKPDIEHKVTVGTGTLSKEYNSYDIEIALSCGEKLDSCQMTVELSGGCTGSDKNVPAATNGTEYITTVEYTWNAERILYGSDAGTQGAVQ